VCFIGGVIVHNFALFVEGKSKAKFAILKLMLQEHSRHNFGHWLLVVLTRIISLALMGTVGAYLMFIGFKLSEDTVKLWLSTQNQEKLKILISLLPYSQIIQEEMFRRLGDWYLEAQSWWTMVVGIPLLIIGASTWVINAFNLLYSLFSWHYNQTHCPFCQREPS
jgi:hypothetical protein